MRIAFSCPPFPGHLYPMTALARKLQQRGHEVIFIGFPDAEPIVRYSGIPFLRFCETTFPPGEIGRRLHLLSQLSGIDAVQCTIDLLADFSKAALAEGPGILTEWPPDALVLDEMDTGLNLVAKAVQMPFITISNAMHFDFSAQTPLCIYAWPHEDTLSAQTRNRRGILEFTKLMSPVLAAQQEFARRAGLQGNFHDLDFGVSRLAHITQTPREFDLPRAVYPTYFHFAGPFYDPTLRSPVEFPWSKLTGEPVVYASLGTLQNGLKWIFDAIVQAAEGPGRQLIVSVGKNINPNEISRRMASTLLLTEVPQVELLQRAVVCVTHAGLNTTLECLSQGVPMVAIPITNDQPGVAARIKYTRTGVVAPIDGLSSAQLGSALDQVLHNPEFAHNANELRRAIECRNGLDSAVNTIEITLQEAVRPSSSTMQGIDHA